MCPPYGLSPFEAFVTRLGPHRSGTAPVGPPLHSDAPGTEDHGHAHTIYAT